MNYPLEKSVGKSGFILAAMVLFIFSSSAWPMEKVNIRHLVQGKKVIPVTCRIGNWQITDIKLPDLVVTNRQKTPATVERVEVIGRISDNESVRLIISSKGLKEAVAETAAMLNSPKLQLPTVQLAFGNVDLPHGPLAENGTAAAGQSLLLPLSKIAYFHHVGHEKINNLEIRLTVKSIGKKTLASFPVPLTHYEARGKYSFPVKGDVQMAFLPMSYIHHRQSASQEFAIDLVGANQKDAASFTEISRPEPRTLSDYSIWGREVLAMGDGLIVEVGDQFPEARMSEVAKFTRPGYTQELLMELIPKIGWTNAVAGNYVIIDHENGEFSAYGHLQEGSIRVKPGERVRKGAVIAKVGNTGNSGAPHLHFQLMDSRNFLTANGLPMMFENVPAQAMIPVMPVTANTLSFSDNIFYAVR